MSLARALVQAPPSVRWHLARAQAAILHRRAFASFGAESVIVAPRILRGVDDIHIGRGVVVNPGAWLQAESGGVLRIGDHTYLGHDVHLHAVDDLTLGRGCVLADGVFVGTSAHDECERSATRGAGPVHIGDDVFIGQRAVVLASVRIGARATVGAGAVVTRDVPPGATVVGVPATVIRGGSPEEENEQ